MLVHPAAEREFGEFDDQTQARFYQAFHHLEQNPFTARPGFDVKKIAALPDGTALYRLRVGRRRSCYSVVAREHEVWILHFADRSIGYKRIIGVARKRHQGNVS